MQPSKKTDKKTYLPQPINNRPLKQRRLLGSQASHSGPSLARSVSQLTQPSSVFPPRNISQLLSFLNDELDLGVKETDLTAPIPQRTVTLYKLLHYQFFWWKEKSPTDQPETKKKGQDSVSADSTKANIAAYKEFNAFLKQLNCPLSYGDYCSSTPQIVQRVVSTLADFWGTLNATIAKFESAISEITAMDEENKRLQKDCEERVSEYEAEAAIILTAELDVQKKLTENEQLDAQIREHRKELHQLTEDINELKQEKGKLKDRTSEVFMIVTQQETNVSMLRELTQIDVQAMKERIKKLTEEQTEIAQKMAGAQKKMDDTDQTNAELKALTISLKKCIQTFEDLKKYNQQLEGLNQTLTTMNEGYSQEQSKESELLNEISYVEKRLKEDEDSVKNILTQREQKRQMTDIEWQKLTKEWEEQLAILKEAEKADVELEQKLKEMDLEISQRKADKQEYRKALMGKLSALAKAIDDKAHEFENLVL